MISRIAPIAVLALLVCADLPSTHGEDRTEKPPLRAPLRAPAINDGPTAFDRYVATADETFEWSIVSKSRSQGALSIVVDLKSQTWLEAEEVDRNVWQHWLTIVVPQGATADTALLFVGGGKNGDEPPQEADRRTRQLALATNSVVAELQMIPNQPLVFHNDGVPRVEDDLIGYTWDQFLKTGDSRWPARLPMVKSVVRAMDTLEAVTRQEEETPAVSNFVIAGGSKRGWTTWMTAAMDSRVVAIAPIVIDVLNVNLSMKHHYAAYGFWAPAVGDYVHHKIMQRRYEPRFQELMQLVDPFAYRDRLTMPKCIINAAGDQFFLPDSSQFYFDELPGEKHLCYVPNADHSLDGSNALETLIAFHYAIVNDVPRPKFTWKYLADSKLEVVPQTKPARVLLWQAHNPRTRDFRMEEIGPAYTSTELQPTDSGIYRAGVSPPKQGWTAYFVQLEFESDAPTPIRLTTPVRVIPNDLPFANQPAPTID